MCTQAYLWARDKLTKVAKRNRTSAPPSMTSTRLGTQISLSRAGFMWDNTPCRWVGLMRGWSVKNVRTVMSSIITAARVEYTMGRRLGWKTVLGTATAALGTAILVANSPWIV